MIKRLFAAWVAILVMATTHAQVQNYGYKDNTFPYQVNIGNGTSATTNGNAWLEVGPKTNNSTRGFLPPRGDKSLVVNPTVGLLIFDIPTQKFWVYANGAWEPIGGIVTWANLTGKPTTISGYGITDAYTKTQVDGFFAGSTALTGYNKTNWDAAYGWGNHAGLYRPIAYVPDWSEILSKPTTFAPSSGSGFYIQNGTTQQTSSNFNISGNGTVGTKLIVGATANFDNELAIISGKVSIVNGLLQVINAGMRGNNYGIATQPKGGFGVGMDYNIAGTGESNFMTYYSTSAGGVNNKGIRIGCYNTTTSTFTGYAMLNDVGSIFYTPIQLPNLTTAPTVTGNGWKYYNTTSNKEQTYINGAWKDALMSGDITATNGLTSTGNAIGLGGTLTANNVIYQNGKFLQFRTGDNGAPFSDRLAIDLSPYGLKVRRNGGGANPFQTGWTYISATNAEYNTITYGNQGTGINRMVEGAYTIQPATNNDGAVGIYGRVVLNSTSGNTHSLYGGDFSAYYNNTTGNNITNVHVRGINVLAQSNNSDATSTLRGISVMAQNINGGTNTPYAIYSYGGINYFKDSVAIGASSFVGTEKLRVNGNVVIDALKTGSTVPTTTGSTKPVIADANGLLSTTDWPASVPGNETIEFLSSNYTVTTTNKRQNLVWEVASNGTITLPTGSSADGLIIIFRNLTVNQVTFSQDIYYSSTQAWATGYTTFGPGVWKFMYNNTTSKWYGIQLD